MGGHCSSNRSLIPLGSYRSTTIDGNRVKHSTTHQQRDMKDYYDEIVNRSDESFAYERGTQNRPAGRWKVGLPVLPVP